ncbi:uncharacterized protein ARMOST_17217 [Armillaria ostoyae]|uniref:Uncharacterized protein n=1 Tax=Armillaria ostoyae TaxID=47428 RepID=A0A284RYD5_ARMOS|nr:uncharacterized protein ARMOST_17217 [Armillaria ostoyae]
MLQTTICGRTCRAPGIPKISGYMPVKLKRQRLQCCRLSSDTVLASHLPAACGYSHREYTRNGLPVGYSKIQTRHAGGGRAAHSRMTTKRIEYPECSAARFLSSYVEPDFRLPSAKTVTRWRIVEEKTTWAESVESNHVSMFQAKPGPIRDNLWQSHQRLQ